MNEAKRKKNKSLEDLQKENELTDFFVLKENKLLSLMLMHSKLLSATWSEKTALCAHNLFFQSKLSIVSA